MQAPMAPFPPATHASDSLAILRIVNRLRFPKRTLFVLANAMTERHHDEIEQQENDINHAAIHGIEKNQGV
jgi:hypothetical protein